jgi:hypothetical protein
MSPDIADTVKIPYLCNLSGRRVRGQIPSHEDIPGFLSYPTTEGPLAGTYPVPGMQWRLLVLPGTQKNFPFQKMTIPTNARIELAMIGITNAYGICWYGSATFIP